jgi:hypothetical protein
MLPPYKPTRRLSLGRSRHFVWASRTPDIRLSSGCSEIGIGSSNPARSANESSTFAILQRDEAVSPRLAEAIEGLELQKLIKLRNGHICHF